MIADAAQNGLGKDYSSVTEGVILVLTIVGWEYFLDWLSFRFPSVRPILKPPALKLIQNGRLEKKNLRKEMLSEEELKSSFANWRSIITKKSDFAILKAMDVSASSRRKPAHRITGYLSNQLSHCGTAPRSKAEGQGGNGGKPRTSRTGPNERLWAAQAPSRESAS
jgi:hypothetical protein